MQFSMLVAATLASVAAAHSNSTASAYWVTDVVTEFTTYCPASTTFSAYGHTYTVTEATTLTLPCPCTVSHYVTPSPIATVSTVPVIYQNTTAPAPTYAVPTTAPAGTPVTTSPPAGFTGAANKLAGSAAGLGGVLAMAAYFL